MSLDVLQQKLSRFFTAAIGVSKPKKAKGNNNKRKAVVVEKGSKKAKLEDWDRDDSEDEEEVNLEEDLQED